MRVLIAATLVFTLAGSLAQGSVFNPKSITLDNGLQVVVVENHMAPVVTNMMWIKAGAADEPRGKSGIAHYLEHLMFKGTTKNPNGVYSKTIAQIGGTENAFTSWDYTAYFATIAKQNLPLVMALEADRLVNLDIRKELAAPELAVVLDERRQRVDDEPFAPLMQQMAAALFPHHPYGIPVIGWKEEIETFTAEDAKAFYRTWYQPSNTILVISGDVKPEEVFALAKANFGNLPKTTLPPRMRAIDPVFTGSNLITLENKHVKDTTISRSYKVPSGRLDAPRSYALQMLEELLDGSQAAFLPKRLVQDKKILTSISASYQGDYYDNGQFTFTMVPKPNVTVDVALAELDAALKDFSEKQVSVQELREASKGLQRQAILARDSVTGPAQTLGLALTTGTSLEEVEAWPEKIGAVTAPDVQQALQAMLQSPPVTGILKPKSGMKPEDIIPVQPSSGEPIR